MSDRDDALVRARALKKELEARGVTTSIEIQQGRPGTPHNQWWDDRFVGSMGHHTVSRRSWGLTPVLALVKSGRSDVPGPLCNGYLGWDQVARIICMGWANHPGAGGSHTLPGGTIPKDNGRPYLFGWEHEGGLDLADWTRKFRDTMGRVHAATLAWLERDERSHIEHKTWAPTRKIDRLNYTLTSARNELGPFLKEDDMPLTDDDVARVAKRTIEGLVDVLRDPDNAKADLVRNWFANHVLDKLADPNDIKGTRAVERIAHAVHMHLEPEPAPPVEPTEPML